MMKMDCFGTGSGKTQFLHFFGNGFGDKVAALIGLKIELHEKLSFTINHNYGII